MAIRHIKWAPLRVFLELQGNQLNVKVFYLFVFFFFYSFPPNQTLIPTTSFSFLLDVDSRLPSQPEIFYHHSLLSPTFLFNRFQVFHPYQGEEGQMASLKVWGTFNLELFSWYYWELEKRADMTPEMVMFVNFGK